MGENCNHHKLLKILKEIVVVIVLSSIILIPFLTNGIVLKYLQKLTGTSCAFLDPQLFHGDENQWLRSAKYFKLFYIDKAINSKEWEQYDSYDQPPVGKYIIGLALVITGQGDKIKELQGISKWNFDHDYNWNVAHGAVPPPQLLNFVRLTMALIGVLTCLLIYYIGRKTFSMKTGIIASLLLAYNPLMVAYSRRAMTDCPLLLFLTINVVLIMFFYQAFLRQKSFNVFVFAILIGINTALAAGTKLNGGLTMIIFIIFCILMVITIAIQYKISERSHADKIKMHRGIKIITSSFLLSIFIAGVVFVGMNPYLYRQPLKRTIKLIEHRMSVVHNQQKYNPKATLTSLNEKFSSVIKRTLLPGNYVILGSIFKIPIDFGLFILGLFILLYLEIKHYIKNCMISSKSVVILWFIITFLGIIIWIPLDWDRYYLPIIPCIVMMVGYSIDKIIVNGWSLLTKKKIVSGY